jgi:diguanylate cyclase (GGDEF)-like protein
MRTFAPTEMERPALSFDGKGKPGGRLLGGGQFDLDRFKPVNDTTGHAAGDLVLMEIATLLKRHIRGSDIACCQGGEEFVLPNATFESARRRGDMSARLTLNFIVMTHPL